MAETTGERPWRVRVRPPGRRRRWVDAGRFPDRPAAEGHAARLRRRYPDHGVRVGRVRPHDAAPWIDAADWNDRYRFVLLGAEDDDGA